MSEDEQTLLTSILWEGQDSLAILFLSQIILTSCLYMYNLQIDTNVNTFFSAIISSFSKLNKLAFTVVYNIYFLNNFLNHINLIDSFQNNEIVYSRFLLNKN